MNFKEKLIKERLPVHVAIIMDGNGRWARKRSAPRVFGHKNAVTAVRETVEAAGELGIKYLTLFAFSTENWSRPKKEIDALMELLVSSIEKEKKKLIENNVRFLMIGNRKTLSDDLITKIDELEDITSENKGLNVVMALSYSSRWEIIDAVKKVGKAVSENLISYENINEELFKSYFDSTGIPDPELLIRTSGEYRISNFLLWQIAYCELFFTETLWPDFRNNDFYEAVYQYQARERRFGKTSEQL